MFMIFYSSQYCNLIMQSIKPIRSLFFSDVFLAYAFGCIFLSRNGFLYWYNLAWCSRTNHLLGRVKCWYSIYEDSVLNEIPNFEQFIWLARKEFCSILIFDSKFQELSLFINLPAYAICEAYFELILCRLSILFKSWDKLPPVQ